MPDQYDAIGGHWENTNDLPMFAALHRSFPALAGDVRGLDVLDVATGTGVYARTWAGAGARRVVATDRSAEMVTAARELEAAQPAGVEYHVADGAEHPDLGPFDLVTAAYLLNYARDEREMAAMASRMYANLRPGGRLIGVVPNPEFPLDGSVDLDPIGMRLTEREQLPVGPLTTLAIFTEPPFAFDFVLARRDAYEDGLTRAGFPAPRWLPMHEPDPDRPDPRFGALEALPVPPCVLFETTRPR